MKYLLFALIAGAISAFAFEPVGFWPLLLVAFAALCELLDRNKSFWMSLAIGWVFGLGQFVVGLNWIATSFTYQSNMPAWLGWVAVLLLSLYLAFYPAIATGLAWWFGRDDRVRMVVVLGGAWAITEWLRSVIFTGFPWNPAAAALAPTPLIQVTALIGTYGLSGLVVLLSGAVWLEYYRKWLPLVVIIGVTHSVVASPFSAVPPDPLTIRNVHIVQPNIGQEDKWRPGFEEESARRLGMLSGTPTAEPRLVLWPEAAITEPVEDQRMEGQGLANFQRERAASVLGPNDLLLTGGIAVESRDGVHVDRAANSVYVLAPGGRIVGRYDKAHLVPYGEYLPMRPLLSYIGLSRLAPGNLDFTPGPGPRTIDIGGEWGKVGSTSAMRSSSRVMSSTSATGPSSSSTRRTTPGSGRGDRRSIWLRRDFARPRKGLPILRATPTGISAVIDARGNVVKQIGWRKLGPSTPSFRRLPTRPPPLPAGAMRSRFSSVSC